MRVIRIKDNPDVPKMAPMTLDEALTKLGDMCYFGRETCSGEIWNTAKRILEAYAEGLNVTTEA